MMTPMIIHGKMSFFSRYIKTKKAVIYFIKYLQVTAFLPEDTNIDQKQVYPFNP